MRCLLLVLGMSVIGCSNSPGPETDETEEEPSNTCDVTVDLNGDGCNDAICKTLLHEGDELGDVVLTEDMVIETRYFGTCTNPQNLVLDPECSSDPDVTGGDGCSEVTCQLPSGTATYKCE